MLFRSSAVIYLYLKMELCFSHDTVAAKWIPLEDPFMDMQGLYRFGRFIKEGRYICFARPLSGLKESSDVAPRCLALWNFA